MSPLVKTIRHDGKTWTVGQAARVTETGYTGRIRSLWLFDGVTKGEPVKGGQVVIIIAPIDPEAMARAA
jgi:hypothetical protein